MRLNAGVTALLLCLVGTTAEAQITWSGTGATANWDAVGNWGPATPPANGFNSGLVFAGSNLLSNTNTLTGGTATSLTFNSGAGAFVIGGNAITLGGNITNSSTSLQTINLDLTSAATRTLTLTANGGNLALAGKLSGAGGYTLGGTGTTTISGAANDYAGNTTFAANQTLNINSAQALGTGAGALVANGNGFFNNTSGSAVSIANNFNVSGGNPTFIGTNNLSITGTTTNSGGNRTLTVSGGTLTLGNVFLSESTATGRLFTIAGTGNTTVSGVIANANGSGQPGRVTITNTGLTIFSGANTYTGTTTVSTNAVVRAADGVGIPTSSPLTLSGGNLETSGTFNRSIGSAAGQVSLANNWGFNASGANLTVDFNGDGAGGTPINWVDTWGFNSPTFVRGTSGSNTVKWVDNLNLQAATPAQTRIVNVGYNALSKSAYLEMSGTYSDLGGVDTSTRLAKGGDGLLVLSGTVASTVELLRFNDGVMRAVAGSNFSLTAQGVEFNTTTAFSSTIASGVLESSGTFNQTVGNSSIPGATRFIGSAGGGWSAFGAKLTVDLNTVSTRDNLTWGTGGFVPNGGVLRFGSQWSDNLVEFRDNIALSGSIRDIGLVDNADSSADYAEISGVLSGNASSGIRKLGTGTLRLSGANTFAGGATIAEGNLLVGVSDNGSTSGGLGTAAAVVGGTSGSAAAAILVDGTFTLSRNITVQAGSTGAATLGGSNTSGTANFTGNVTLNRSVTLQAAAAGTVAFDTGSWTTNDNAVTIGSAGNTGSVRIANTLSSTGGVTVAFGTLVVPSGGGLGSGNPLAVSAGARANVDYANPSLGGVTNSGSLAFGSTSGTATLAALSGGGSTAFSSDAAVTSLNGNTISIGSKNLAVASGTFGGSISGAGGSLTKTGSGRLEITAANAYTGATTIAGGTLALSGAGSLDGASAVALTAAGATFDIAGVSPTGITIGTLSGSAGSAVALGSKNLLVNQTADAIFAGAIAGTGGFSKQGTATLTLTGTSSYTGATSVDAGRLLVDGQLGTTAVTVNAGGLLGGSGRVLGSVAVLASGTFSPGSSPGLFEAGSMTLSGVTLMEIDAVGGRGTAYDAVTVTNSLTYGGSMEIDFAFVSAVPDFTVFNLFDFGSQSGLFSGITTKNDGSYYGGLSFSGVGDVWTATKGSQTLEFTFSTGNLVVVPEPQAAVLAGLGAALAAAVLRCRRRR